VAHFLRGQADRIRKHFTSSVIQVGKSLLEAKRYLAHGSFLSWVESEVGIPARTAQDYMRVATWAKGKSATVAHLPASVLYMLSKTGVPEHVVAEVISLAEAGHRITASAVRSRLNEFRASASTKRSETEGHHQGDTGRMVFSTDVDDALPDLIAELVSLLSENLSTVDFARVREIMTSDLVISHPQSLQHVRAAFNAIQGSFGTPGVVSN
jgi:hypothetical protein